MPTLMPTDANGIPVPVLRLRAGGAHRLQAGAQSQRIGPFAADTKVIGVYADGPVFIATGNGAVTAGEADHFLPAGQCLDLSLGGCMVTAHTHLAAVRAAGDCVLYVSEKE